MPRYLTRRNGVWYVNVNVPRSLHGALGANLQRSLKTTDEKQAGKLMHKVVAEFLAAIEEAGRGPLGQLDTLTETARRYRDGRGVTEAEYDATLEAVLESYPRDAQGAPEVPPSDRAKIRKASSIASGLESLLLTSLVEKWHAVEDAKGFTHSTNVMRRRMLGRFLAWMGEDAEPSNITKAKAASYIADVVNAMDSTHTERLKAAGYPSSFVDWLVIHDYLDANPLTLAKRLMRKPSQDETDDGESNRKWTDSEMAGVLGRLPKDGLELPLVLLLAYTGARPRELCDVRKANVTPVAIGIKDSKTPKGIRDVPIHPILAPLVAHLVEASTDEYLLPGLKASGKDRDRYKLLGKKVRPHVHAQAAGDEAFQVYGTRTTVNTKMKEAGVPEWMCERVCGHAPKSVNGRNYTDASIEAVAQALGQVSYGPDVDALAVTLGRGYRLRTTTRAKRAS